MEENILVPAPEYKLNKEWAIFLAAFLGGPLSGGFLMAENFRQLGESSKARITIVLSVVGFLFLFFLPIVPGMEKVPPYAIAVASLIAIRSLVKFYQEKQIRAHIETGGRTYSILRAIVAGLLSLAMYLSILFYLYTRHLG